MNLVAAAVVATPALAFLGWWLPKQLHADRVRMEFDAYGRYCHCGTAWELGRIQAAAFEVVCPNPACSYRAMIPTSVLFEHGCQDDDFVPMGRPHRDGHLQIQTTRCAVCGRRAETINGVPAASWTATIGL